MSRVHSKDSRVLVNQYSESCDITGYTCSHRRAMSPITTICDDSMHFIPGQLSGALSLAGLFDSTAGSLYQASMAAQGVDDGYLVTVAPAGYTVGNPAFITVSDLTSVTNSITVTDAVPVNIEAQPDNGVDWGVLLHGLTAETVTANGSTVDQLAATTNGAVASLHLTAYATITNIVVKVQHSTNGSAWSDLITFTTATGITSERKTVSGTINQFVRSIHTISGSGSATFAVAFARR